MTYEESAALMKDQTFISRVKVACLNFAAYIFGEPASTPAHNTRFRWSQNTMQAPDVSANLVVPTVVMEDTVQQQGSTISDADLQTAVETAINMML